MGTNKQRLVVALATFIVSALVSLTVCIGYAASRNPREPSSKQWLRVVFTPFTLHRGEAFEQVIEDVHLPIYPGSVPIETGTFDEQDEHSASSNFLGSVFAADKHT
jgi:hypothetical protein